MPIGEIREIELSQVPLVARLPQPGEAGADTPERMERYLRGEHDPHLALPPRRMWVAWDGAAPMGYVSGHLTARFSCDGELQKIYVAAAYRRQGLGFRLVQELARWFRALDARRVCVNVGDESARPFYVAVGATALQSHWMVWADIQSVLGQPEAGSRGAV